MLIKLIVFLQFGFSLPVSSAKFLNEMEDVIPFREWECYRRHTQNLSKVVSVIWDKEAHSIEYFF